jgi:hypothetical protein
MNNGTKTPAETNGDFADDYPEVENYRDFPGEGDCWDDEAQADLALHDELFPNGYVG